jgi:hypothetical protein
MSSLFPSSSGSFDAPAVFLSMLSKHARVQNILPSVPHRLGGSYSGDKLLLVRPQQDLHREHQDFAR